MQQGCYQTQQMKNKPLPLSLLSSNYSFRLGNYLKKKIRYTALTAQCNLPNTLICSILAMDSFRLHIDAAQHNLLQF
jgi:hypothetical protein